MRTDAGEGYLKAPNNPEGEQVIGCDWLGTILASEFGLPTLQIAKLTLDPDDDIPLTKNLKAAGTVMISKAEQGSTLGGGKDLKSIVNPDDLSRMIALDTWTKNCDRYAPGMGAKGKPRKNFDNIFLARPVAGSAKKITMIPIDFGCILTCGRQITSHLNRLGSVREELIYGFFPFFEGFVKIEAFAALATELGAFGKDRLKSIVDLVPEEWGFTSQVKAIVTDFLYDRAQFLSAKLPELIDRYLHPNDLFSK